MLCNETLPLELTSQGQETGQPDEHGGDTVSHPGVRLDFSINVNPLGVPEEVLHAIADGLDPRAGPQSSQSRLRETLASYPDPQCRELRRTLAGRHGVGMGQILCGNGASDLIDRLVDARRPGRVLVMAPTFTEYERTSRVAGASVIHHRLDPPFFDLTETVLDAITDEMDIVFCCQPNNPTGRLIDPCLMARLIDRTRETHTLLVMDECFLPFTDAPSLIPRPDPHILVLRAFTKTHGLAGLRLGYAVCPDETLIASMADHGPRWNVSTLAQIAGVAALADTAWEHDTRTLVRQEREWLTDALTRLGLAVVPSQANFLLFRSSAELFGPLLERGILIRSCSNFVGLDETWYRIGVKQRSDNQQLINAMEEVSHDR